MCPVPLGAHDAGMTWSYDMTRVLVNEHRDGLLEEARRNRMARPGRRARRSRRGARVERPVPVADPLVPPTELSRRPAPERTAA